MHTPGAPDLGASGSLHNAPRTSTVGVMALRLVGYGTALVGAVGLYLLGYHGYGVSLFLLVCSTALNVEAVSNSNLHDGTGQALRIGDDHRSQSGSDQGGAGAGQILEELRTVGSDVLAVATSGTPVPLQVHGGSGPVHTSSIRRSWVRAV